MLKFLLIHSEDDGKYIQRGWLMSNSEIHIRLSSSSCKFFKSNIFTPHSQLFVSCSRYVLQPNCIEDEDLELATLDNTATKPEFLPDQQTLSNENKVQNAWPSRFTRRSAGKPSYYSMVCRAHPVLMSTLEISRCRVHRGEQPDCSGTLYKVGDDVTFFIETWDVENTSVEIEFYQQPNEPGVNDTKNIGGSQLKFIGSARFGPFVDTYGRKAAQILNSSHRPVGDLRVRYLVIHPMVKSPNLNLKVTYQHHWKKRGVVMDIGHRGMGTSFLEPEQKPFKKTPSTKENTLDSFRTAVQHGADFVEMDVQLTKDHQVVVYHDFDAVVISKKKRGGQLSYLRIAIKDMNYEDLRELNVRHSSVLKESHSHEKMNEEDLDPIDLQPFPLLRSCFEEIDSDLGFVIEVKYPMELKQGGSEMDHFFEYNFYVDTILREILTYAGSRRIMLSCFDPNVSVMLQLKQNLYPVFQLGISPEYADTRHNDFEHLFFSAISHQLMGVCLESDRLLNVPDVIKLAHLHNLVVLAWGEAVNNPEKRAQLIQLGVDGIIYDCLHENKAKGTLSIFKRERCIESSSYTLDEYENKLSDSSLQQQTLPNRSSCFTDNSVLFSIPKHDDSNNINNEVVELQHQKMVDDTSAGSDYYSYHPSNSINKHNSDNDDGGGDGAKNIDNDKVVLLQNTIKSGNGKQSTNSVVNVINCDNEIGENTSIISSSSSSSSSTATFEGQQPPPPPEQQQQQSKQQKEQHSMPLITIA
uniref:GP-PDE domain-containing protein n=1 Tax=Trichobilharzia regenti TaxID=157069 RepID=A0AA85JJ18_TRIRE|nr:unnamed protein product [Trichobilharzia regenti]